MSASPDILTLILARGGSKRLPGKNIRSLGGHSLLAWTVAAARAAGLVRTLILSTDDADVAAEGEALGVPAPFTRPAALSDDASSSVDAAVHALDWFEGENGAAPALLVLLQPTSPFRPAGMVREGIDRVTANAGADALITVTPVHVGSGSIYADGGGYLTGIDPAGATDRCVVPSGALYVIRPAALRRDGTFVPECTLSLAHSGASALDIDTPDDWALAEAVVAAGLVAFPVTLDEEARRTARA